MCDEAVGSEPYSLQFLSDWFVTQEQIKIWDNDDDYYDDDELTEWSDDYHKRKVQKSKITEELLTIAFHPDRVMDWCMSEDEKKEIEKLWK